MGTDEHRVRRIKQYVLLRLREELANAPRGAQASLAKRLGVSGAHLSNMLSATPSRQPGEDFRRKVAAHWSISYAQLEAIAFGEEMPPASSSKPVSGRGEEMPPSLVAVLNAYAWLPELPVDLRTLVRDQARLHCAYARHELTPEEWQRVLTGLEREALAFVASRSEKAQVVSDPPHDSARKRLARS